MIRKVLCIVIIIMLICSGCSNNEMSAKKSGKNSDSKSSTQLIVKTDEQNKDIIYDLSEFSSNKNNTYSHIYSTINNWPSVKFYAAKGVKVSSILNRAGLLDSAQSVTFKSQDGYECTLTKEQLEQKRYYYPKIQSDNSTEGAEPTEIILATALVEDSQDLSSIEGTKPCLIFGQSNPFEHSNPAFVENVSEIIVSTKQPEQWEIASTFPQQGMISKGEKVKIEHPNMGLVKIFYTLDGTEPTESSYMYNPSTYQPELNVPITINQDTTIKVLVSGYGKRNSEVTTYHFKVK